MNYDPFWIKYGSTESDGKESEYLQNAHYRSHHCSLNILRYSPPSLVARGARRSPHRSMTDLQDNWPEFVSAVGRDSGALGRRAPPCSHVLPRTWRNPRLSHSNRTWCWLNFNRSKSLGRWGSTSQGETINRSKQCFSHQQPVTD
jgi:hypothetical protein